VNAHKYNETHAVVLVKPADRALRDDVISRNMSLLVSKTSDRSLRAQGWDVEGMGSDVVISTPETRKEYGLEDSPSRDIYLMRVQITYGYHQAPPKGMLGGILRKMAGKSQTPQYGSWYLATVDGKPYTMPADDDVTVDDPDAMVGYTDVTIPANWSSHFSHLYGLDAQVRMVRRAIEVGIASGWRKRLSVVLVGDPGCGKSDIAESVMRAVGEEAVWRMDATATTSAGTIKELGELEILPRIIILEEAEKANEKVTEPFLGILDQRGEVNKLTARGKISRDARCIMISTVNDYDKFCKMNAGALESRHTVKVFFNRPDRRTLELILNREIKSMGDAGSASWIEPALDYCQAHNINDPRHVISLCLAGGNDWLNGQFEKDLEDTAQPK